MSGKQTRMDRIFEPHSGNAVIVPLDHGVTLGPLDGLVEIGKTIRDVTEGGATAVVMHKGMIRNCGKELHEIGLIMHLSASGGDHREYGKVTVATVVEAVRSHADAVSMHVVFGSAEEGRMLSELGTVSEECEQREMPLMVMAYPQERKKMYDPEAIAHCARAVSELGADVVKVPYTGDTNSFGKVVEGSLSPVVIAGGPRMDSEMDVLRIIEDSMTSGARGVSIGRNIFQSKDARAMTAAVRNIVVNGMTAAEAYNGLR